MLADISRRAAAAASVALAACSPTYDWRETRPPDAAVLALFPCKPDRHSRPQVLAGASVQMLLASCTAGNATFALAHVQLADASQVTPALHALREAAASNVAATAQLFAPMAVAGMAPNPLAERLRIEGRRPDGGRLQMQAGFFAFGSRVYQASVVGAALDAEAVDTFFDGLRLAP